MHEWINNLTDWLALRQNWLFGATFLIAFLESLAIAGLLVPGVAALFAVAALAGHADFNLWTLLGAAIAGAILGDGLSFLLGKKLQGRLDRIWPLSRHPELIQRGESLFAHYGGLSVVIGRFVGPVRPVIPMVAGALAMPTGRFVAYNVASAILWAPVYLLPGFFVGASLALDIQLPSHFYPLLGISLLLLAGIYWLFFQLHGVFDAPAPLHRAIARWMARYQSSHRFWRAFSRQHPEGGDFPLPALMLALSCLALFSVWTLLTLHTFWLQRFDLAVMGFFSSLRHPLFDPPFIALTLLADAKLLWITFPLMVLALAFRGYYAAAIHIALAGLATLFIIHQLKDVFDLLRPQTVQMPPQSGSYPSGHTTAAVMWLGLLASFGTQELAARKRWLVYFLVSLPALGIAISRLYLGVHWFSDVIGGLLLGLIICSITRVSYSRYDQTPLTLDWSSLLATALGISAIVGYIAWHWQAAVMAYRPVI